MRTPPLLLVASAFLLASPAAFAAPSSSMPARVVPVVDDAPLRDLSAPQVFTFLDGGASRLATRGAIPGRDDALVDVVYEDPQSGRRTQARAGASVIVELVAPRDHDAAADADAEDADAAGWSAPRAQRSLESLDVEVVRVLMPRRGLVQVRSRHANEDALALAQRLISDVQRGRSSTARQEGAVVREAFPDLWLAHRTLDDGAIAIPPDDPRYVGQFFLHDIGIEDAWALSTGAPDVEVLVVDNGCDAAHPDLAAKMLPGTDVVDDDDDPAFAPQGQGNEHGTACAGLIGAITDNGVDVAGACPQCSLRCARMLGDTGTPLNADVRAFQFAFSSDVDVVSNSWGFVDAIPVPQVLADAIVEVQQNGRGGLGAVVVFAAGNDSRLIGDDELLAVPGVLGVGATNNIGELTQFTNRGPSVDVVAPTGTISTDISGPAGADPGDVTTHFGGTSSACPIVSGVAGLLLAAAPDLRADDVDDILMRTAQQSVLARPDASGHDDEYGYGQIVPAAALREVVPAESGEGEAEGEGEGEGDAPPMCSHVATRAPHGCTWPGAAAVVLVVALLRRRRAGPERSPA